MPSRASDVYALAATAFALLSGAAPAGVLPPWDGIEPAQAEQLEAAIRLGLATDPARRPATPGELVERLRGGWGAALPTGVMTFCLSDIEGSTALWDGDPAAMAEALVRHDEIIADAVEARGGRFIESMGEGDSTVSVFDSAPRGARGRARRQPCPGGRAVAGWATARRALRAAHAARPSARDATTSARPSTSAARLRAQADGGQIFVSAATAELVAEASPGGLRARRPRPAPPARARRAGAHPGPQGPGVDAPPPASECPYRGLLAFEPDDRAVLLRPRGTSSTEIVGRARSPAGCWRSSARRAAASRRVLRAGVVGGRARRRGRRDRATLVLLTPGRRAAHSRCPTSPARLVVVDQFEELFTLCDDAERRARVHRPRCWRCAAPVVIGVRADLYGRLSGQRELARAVAGNQVLLGAMSDDELARAITEPARLAGLRLEPGLVELILRDVADEPGALPLLSHALRATWERRDGRTLTVEGYRASGGVASAIARTADSVVDGAAGRAATAGAQRVPAHDRARRGERGHAPARRRRRARARGGVARGGRARCSSGWPTRGS